MDIGHSVHPEPLPYVKNTIVFNALDEISIEYRHFVTKKWLWMKYCMGSS